MTRFLMSTLAVVALLAPVAASAATHHTRHMTHSTGRLSAHPSGGRTQAGDAAVDRLNDQSLARARAGATAPAAQ